MTPKLPKLLGTKIYKTGQTRGADDDVIFQNRVLRNNTVLIRYQFTTPIIYPVGEDGFENGFIVLISPKTYFNNQDIGNALKQRNLVLGENCLLFYETRQDWDKYDPDELGWKPAQKRKAPLGGNYVARVPATTAAIKGEKINRGFTTKACKGAGIRQYEFASSKTIKRARLQLEAIYWLCFNSIEAVVQYNKTADNAKSRKDQILIDAEREGLLDYNLLRMARIINQDNQTMCPLCREKLSAIGFFNRMSLAKGREVPDLTITDINLFHIDDLRQGAYNHRPYNLGWGHHHCNVVAKDVGIQKTLEWMQQVLDRNKGYV